MALNITFYDGIRYHRMDFINRDKDFFGNGVVNATDFPSSFPGGMQIGLGVGTAWVDGYRINNDSSSTVTLTVPSADPTNPRIDIIQIGHDDVNGVASLVIKEGVAAASPVEPSADPNYVKLYAISVPANATSISSSSITDRRALVPLNVNGSQISLNGAANPNQTNNFKVSQEFTATTSSILANQIVLGQTNNVSGAKAQIYLASASADGVGLDVVGNLIPINPVTVGSGFNWNVRDKNDNDILKVFIDGSKQLQSANNTLDDGSGNITYKGNIYNSLGYFMDNGAMSVHAPSSRPNTDSWGVIDTNGGKVLSVNTGGTKKVSTINNTLDDGAGNVTASGTVTAGKGLASTLVIGGQSGANPFIQADYNGTTNSQLVWQIDSGSLYVDVKGSFVIRNDPNSGSPIFTVSNAGAVSTVKNTLDDGNGNVTASGNMTISGNVSLSSKLTLTMANAGIEVGSTTSSNTPYIDFHSSGANNDYDARIIASGGSTTANAMGTLSLYGGSIQTNKNILDDGSGNMTVNGGLYANSSVSFSGNTNLMPKGTASSSSNYSSNLLAFGSSTWNGSAAVTNWRNLWMDSTNKIILANLSGTNSFTVDNGGNGWFGGGLASKNNTLDDGNGNIFASSRISATGFSTSNTGGTSAGQWIRIGTMTITSQYSDAEAYATVIGSGSGGSSSRFRFYWRVKQQGAMGTAPVIELTMVDQAGTVNTNLVAVTTTNSTSQTIVDLYVKMPIAYESYYINPNHVVSSNFINWQTGQSFVTSLPAGTQTVSSYNNTLFSASNTLDDGSGNMTVNNTVTVNQGATNNVALKLTSSGTGWGSGLQFINATASTGKTWGMYSGSEGNFHLSDPAGYDTVLLKSGGVVTSKNNTLDDGSGNLAAAGKVSIEGGHPLELQSASSGSWYWLDDNQGTFRISWGSSLGQNVPFTVNANTVATLHNTLDDGTGNMTVSSNIYMPNNSTATNATKKTQLLPGGATIQGISGGLLSMADAGNAWLVAFSTSGDLGLAGQLTTGSSITANNGIINANGSNDSMLQIKGKGSVGSFPGWNANMLYVNAYSNGGTETQSFSSGVKIKGAIIGDRNTFDDGNGNMSTTGSITTSGGLIVNNYLWMKPSATATSTNNYASQILELQNSTWNGTSAVTNARNLYVDGSGNFQFTNYGGSSNIFTVDTAGNATFAGYIHVKSNIVLPNFTSIQGYETDGATVKNLAYVDNSNVARFGDTTISTKIDGTSVITKNNTLDDGNGSMTVHTNLFVSTGGVYIPNASWFSGHDTSGTGHGLVMMDSSNKTLLNTDGSMGGLWTAFNGAAMSELEDGNGNMNVKNNVTVNGQLYVYNQSNLYNHVNVMPVGTATSSTNYNSQLLAFGNSTWNGSSAVTNWRNIFVDTSNNLQITNVNATSNVFTIDPSGNVTASGNVSVGGALTLTGANAIKLDNYGNISAVGTTSSTWNVVDKNSVNVLYVTMSGAKSVGTANFQIDDGSGNIVKNNGTFAIKNTNPSSGGYIVLQSLNDKVYLQSPSSMGIYCVAPNTTATYVPIAASAFNVNSLEAVKTNIEPWNISALDVINQSVIYEYNLKAELAEGLEKKRHGFVIGRETPEAIIDNDAIEHYGMSALNTKAIQELIERDKQKDARIKELEEKLAAVMLKLGA